MSEWSCDNCKKKIPDKDLTELFAWGMYICTPCIEKWLDEKEPEKSSQWIKCSDRLPDNGEVVIVFNSSIRKSMFGQFIIFDDGTKMYSDNITHWMPMPEAPHD